jgi:hypothetical protein
MPVLLPSTLSDTVVNNPATIYNLEGEVILRTENQTTQTARADIWIRDALLEISGNPDYRDDFDDLEVFGPLFNLTGGSSIAAGAVQEYSFDNIISQFNAQNVPDYNLSTLDILIWIDYPTNQNRRRLNYTSYQASDKVPQYTSLPSEWYRFGYAFGVSPSPDRNYQVQARYLRRHPIIDYFNTSGLLNTTPILIPTEWNEVVIWAAVMRGFMEFLEFERANEVHTMLYGDPKEPKNPGLVKNIKSRRRRENWRQQQSLRPIVHTLGFGTRGGR